MSTKAQRISWLKGKIVQYKKSWNKRNATLQSGKLSPKQARSSQSKLNDMLGKMKAWKKELKEKAGSHVANLYVLPGETKVITEKEGKINQLIVILKKQSIEYNTLRNKNPKTMSVIANKARLNKMLIIYNSMNKNRISLHNLSPNTKFSLPRRLTMEETREAQVPKAKVKPADTYRTDAKKLIDITRKATNAAKEQKTASYIPGNAIGNISYEIKKSIGNDEIVFTIPITNTTQKTRFYYVDLRNAAGTFIEKEPDTAIRLTSGKSKMIKLSSSYKLWNLSTVQNQNVRFELKESWNRVVGFKVVAVKYKKVESYSKSGIPEAPKDVRKYGIPSQIVPDKITIEPKKVFGVLRQSYNDMKISYNNARDLMDQLKEEAKHAKLKSDKINIAAFNTAWKSIKTYVKAVDYLNNKILGAMGLSGVIDDQINELKNKIEILKTKIKSLISGLRSFFKTLLSRLDSKFSEMSKLYYDANNLNQEINRNVTVGTRDRVRSINMKWTRIKTSSNGIVQINSKYKTIKDRFSSKQINGLGAIGVVITGSILALIALVVITIGILVAFIVSMKRIAGEQAQREQNQPIVDETKEMFDTAEKYDDMAQDAYTNGDTAAGDKYSELADQTRVRATDTHEKTKSDDVEDEDKIFGFLDKKDLIFVGVGVALLMTAPIIMKSVTGEISKSMESKK